MDQIDSGIHYRRTHYPHSMCLLLLLLSFHRYRLRFDPFPLHDSDHVWPISWAAAAVADLLITTVACSFPKSISKRIVVANNDDDAVTLHYSSVRPHHFPNAYSSEQSRLPSSSPSCPSKIVGNKNLSKRNITHISRALYTQNTRLASTTKFPIKLL